jgi:hypothetical protein
MAGRRYSPQVKAAHRQLGRTGGEVSSLRQLESWYGPPTAAAGGLAPPEGTPVDVVVDHLMELARFLGPPGAGRGQRPSADVAACHLAVRMFPTERHRLVVVRELRLDEVWRLRYLRDETADDDDLRSAVADDVAARVVGAAPGELPRWLRPWAERFATNLAHHPGMLDEPEQMVLAVLTQMSWVLLGGSPYPYEPGHFHATLGNDPPTSGLDLDDESNLANAHEVFRGLNVDLYGAAEFVRDEPPIRLAASAATWLPTFVELRARVNIRVSDTQLKMVAAILGPALTAASFDQPVCRISGAHPVPRVGARSCVFCGASPDGRPVMTI